MSTTVIPTPGDLAAGQSPAGQPVADQPAQPSGQPVADQPDPADDPLGEPGMRALERVREERRAATERAEAAEARLAQIERDALSELDRARLDAEEARAAAAAAQQDALRARIQATHRLSDEDAALLLTGADEATLTAQAQRLAALTAVPQAPTGPQPVPTIGMTPQHTGNVPIAEQIAAAERAGNAALVAGLKAIQLGSPLNTR